MENKSIETSIKIDAPAAIVWRVFIDPELTRQMGGEIVSEWKQDSSYRWKGIDGKIYTDGKILEIEQEKLLKHSLIDANDEVTNIITYSFAEEDGKTLLTGREEFSHPPSESQLREGHSGWEEALKQVQQIAEKAAE
jgi:uncharacterized protein YndB with AHSA1/START domain